MECDTVLSGRESLIFDNIGSEVHFTIYVEEIQQDATECKYLLLLNYSTCFRRPSRPSSGVHKNVVVASGTDHTIWEASLKLTAQIA